MMLIVAEDMMDETLVRGGMTEEWDPGSTCECTPPGKLS